MKKIVIIPGGYHPYHAGHRALYDAAKAAFPSADVYVAATADTSTRPFPFEVKQKLAKLAGIPPHRFIQVKSPFAVKEITQMYDPDDTVLIYVRSEKDRDSQPQPGAIKKDGTPGYLQPYKRNGLEPMSKHGYMAYLPVVQFADGMTSATEIRAKWPTMDPKQKASLVNKLYPATQGNDKLTGVVVKMFDTTLGEKVDEFAPIAGAVGGALAGSVYGAAGGGPIGQIAASALGSEIASGLSDSNEVEEARLVNDPEQGHVIIPDGGMGSWNEKSLQSNLARKFASMLEMLKAGDYERLHRVLAKGEVVDSMLTALAQYQRFKTKQGNRAIAQGREIDLGAVSEDYIEEAKK